MNSVTDLFAALDAAASEPSAAPETVAEDTSDKPFATLRIGPTGYQIGEGEGEGVLKYRVGEDGDWIDLQRNQAEGWQRIGAEILISTRDALYDYANMHVIKITEEGAEPDVFEYDLFDFRFELQSDMSGGVIMLNIPEMGWVEVHDENPADYNSRRELAVHALFSAAPQLADEFADDVEAWAERLAAGATVEPYI